MKIICFILNVITSMYFMGDLIIQHPKAKNILNDVDLGFSSILDKLKNKQSLPIMDLISSMLENISLISFFGVFIFPFVGLKSAILLNSLIAIFFCSMLISGSIAWILHHGSILKSTIKLILLFGFGSLLFPILDAYSSSGLTHYLYMTFRTAIHSIYLLPENADLTYESLVVSSGYCAIIMFFYLTGWLLSVPISLVSLLVVASPIYTARFISRAFPVKPSASLFVVIWLYTLIYLTFWQST